MKTLRLGPALVAEALGTFILVFAGCGAIVIGKLPPSGVAAAFGLAVMVSVYAFGQVSGAHFNPAVSLAFAVGGHFPAARLLPYWGAQLAGAVAAAGLLLATLGSVKAAVVQPASSNAQALAWEGVLTFMLMLVIVAVATDARAVGPWAAIAIGGAVALGSLVGGPISGAAMNPARALGPDLLSGQVANVWIYIVGPAMGACLAAVTYRYVAEPLASAG
ncbi:MAG: aquaporin [Candidatus Limnocylindrales bacterium]